MGRVRISISPGLLGFFNDNFVRLLIPLCATCHGRMRRGRSALFFRVVLALVLGSAAIIAFSVTVLEHSTLPRVLSAAIGLCFCAPLVSMLRTELRRPSPAKLVKVVRASSPADWMEVRFGNPDYARLVDELYGMSPDRQENRKPTKPGTLEE
jgi:hypothetical protein